MSIDIPHAIATAIIIFVTIFGLERIVFSESTSKTKKAIITALVLVVLIFCLNIIWPSSSSLGTP